MCISTITRFNLILYILTQAVSFRLLQNIHIRFTGGSSQCHAGKGIERKKADSGRNQGDGRQILHHG